MSRFHSVDLLELDLLKIDLLEIELFDIDLLFSWRTYFRTYLDREEYPGKLVQKKWTSGQD